MAAPRRFESSAGLIAALTLASRVLGLLRESLFSYYFSTSELLSAFRIAFQVPNLTRRLFGEGALSSAMIPVLTDSLHTRGEEASRRFVGTLMVVLLAVLVVGVVVIELAIVGWRAVCDDVALELTALLMPYAALVCTVAVAGGVLNVRRHFATPAAAPALLNVAIIVALLGGAGYAGLRGVDLMYTVCSGVLVAGLLQVILMWIALRRVGFLPLFGGSWNDSQLRRVLALMAPMALGLSAVQINTLADNVIAYLFIEVDGERSGPAVLSYAHFLYQLPLGVFGISLATAIFPVLSTRATEGDLQGMGRIFERGLRLALFIALPASIGLMFVAGPLVATIYERGKFGPADTERVAGTLVFYSVGLVAYFTQHLVVRAFYALGNSRTPARIAVAMVSVNLAMNLSLVSVLQERGLALATAVCAVIQVLWLIRRLRPSLPEIRWRVIGASVARTVTAASVMTVALIGLTMSDVLTRFGVDGSVARLIVLVMAGAVIYGGVARILAMEELKQVLPHRKSRK